MKKRNFGPHLLHVSSEMAQMFPCLFWLICGNVSFSQITERVRDKNWARSLLRQYEFNETRHASIEIPNVCIEQRACHLDNKCHSADGVRAFCEVSRFEQTSFC